MQTLWVDSVELETELEEAKLCSSPEPSAGYVSPEDLSNFRCALQGPTLYHAVLSL